MTSIEQPAALVSKLPSRFPVRAYLRFVLPYFALQILFLITALVLWKAAPADSLRAEGRVLFWLFFLSSTSVGLGLAFKMIAPLGRMVRKAINLFRDPRIYSLEELQTEESQEWEDLESRLDRIGRRFLTKNDRLRRERDDLQAIVSAISEAVCVIDEKGGLIFFNSVFEEKFLKRFPRLAYPYSITLSEVFRLPELLDVVRRGLSKKEWGSAFCRIPVDLESAFSNRIFRVSVSAFQKLYAKNIQNGALLVFYDLTELKDAERVSQELMERVSHELRTPLTSIKGYAHALQEDLREGKLESADRFLDIILKNSDRLTDQIQILIEQKSSLEQSRPGDGNPTRP